MNDLREACIQFHLPVEPELLCQLMDYCDSDKDGQINYLDFANFLNWKDKMPSGLGMCMILIFHLQKSKFTLNIWTDMPV